MPNDPSQDAGVGTLVKSLGVLVVILIIATMYLIFGASSTAVYLEPAEPVEGPYYVYEYTTLTEETQEVIDYGLRTGDDAGVHEDNTNIDLDYAHIGVIDSDGDLHTFAVDPDTSRSTALTVLILMGVFLVIANLAAIIVV